MRVLTALVICSLSLYCMARNFQGTKFSKISSEIATFFEKILGLILIPIHMFIIQVKMDGSDIWTSFEVYIISGSYLVSLL